MTDTTATHAAPDADDSDRAMMTDILATQPAQAALATHIDRTAAEDQHIVDGLYRELHDIAYAQVA